MPMDNDVDLVFLQAAHVHLRPHRRRGAVEDIRDLRGNHGPSPAVCQSRSRALLGDIFVVLIHSYMRTMHQLHDLPHRAPGHHTVFSPGFQGLSRHAIGKGYLSLHLRVGPLQFLIEIMRDVVCLTALCLDPYRLCDLFQFIGILDGVILDVSIDHLPEHIEHGHAVIGVRCGAARHHTGKVPCHDGINGSPANTDLRIRILGIQTARPHRTVLTAGRVRSDRAGLHARCTVECGLDPIPSSLLEHLCSALAARQLSHIHPFERNNLLFIFYLLVHPIYSSCYKIASRSYITSRKRDLKTLLPCLAGSHRGQKGLAIL